jgi:hypothetical protein
VFFLETVQSALNGADLYYWVAVGFGKPNHLFSSFLSLLDVPIMGSFVASIFRFFFVYRIWVISEKRRWWLCASICLVNSFPKFRNDPSRSSPFRCIRGVHGQYFCKSPQSDVADHVSSQQSYISEPFMEALGMLIFEVVSPSNTLDGLPLTEYCVSSDLACRKHAV